MPIPITARGAKMLKDELQRLKTQDRPAVVQAIAEAREKGDLSENAEYDAARESQAFIEGRILELESKIAQFQVIDPTTLPDNGKVVFSATRLKTSKPVIARPFRSWAMTKATPSSAVFPLPARWLVP